ncbi:MAG: hypothetical protein CMM25_02780 [Rhodospirillaceae bacterium]|nr:hypothetical protein [Rhodospirillaceae bacterium]
MEFYGQVFLSDIFSSYNLVTIVVLFLFVCVLLAAGAYFIWTEQISRYFGWGWNYKCVKGKCSQVDGGTQTKEECEKACGPGDGGPGDGGCTDPSFACYKTATIDGTAQGRCYAISGSKDCGSLGCAYQEEIDLNKIDRCKNAPTANCCWAENGSTQRDGDCADQSPKGSWFTTKTDSRGNQLCSKRTTVPTTNEPGTTNCCKSKVYKNYQHYNHNSINKYICSPLDNAEPDKSYSCVSADSYHYDNDLCESYGQVPDAGNWKIDTKKAASNGKYIACRWADPSVEAMCWGGTDNTMGGGQGGCNKAPYSLWTGITYRNGAKGDGVGEHRLTPLCMKDIAPIKCT